jgi:hypothetical protein
MINDILKAFNSIHADGYQVTKLCLNCKDLYALKQQTEWAQQVVAFEQTFWGADVAIDKYLPDNVISVAGYYTDCSLEDARRLPPVVVEYWCKGSGPYTTIAKAVGSTPTY